MLSNDQIYHLAASRLGDKCDRSMTRGKLLDNIPTIFIFISETSVVWLDYLLIVYTYFMTTRETVKLLSLVSGEVLRKPMAIVSQIFSSTQDYGWLLPCSHETTVVLPNCLKTTQHCQQYADACRRYRAFKILINSVSSFS